MRHRWTIDDVLFLFILFAANFAVMWFMPALISGAVGYIVGAAGGILTMVAINTRFPD